MDYADIIEKYVQEAWDRGETTPAIKAQLVAKRWPPEMVDVVVDNLVRKRVAAQEGEKPVVTGPDLWSQPTWPQASNGWSKPSPTASSGIARLSNSSVLKTSHKRKFSSMIQENSHLSPTGEQPVAPQSSRPDQATIAAVNTSSAVPATVQSPSESTTEFTAEPSPLLPNNDTAEPQPVPTLTSDVASEPQPVLVNTQVFTDTPGKNGQEVEPASPAQTDADSSAIIQAAQAINQELDKVLASLSEPETASAPVTVPSSAPVEKITKDQIIANLQAREDGQKKLPQKLQESRTLRSEDEKIQLRSLIFLGMLFFVIILALIWHFFVIK